MKKLVIAVTLLLSSNAFAHGLSPSEVYTILTTASTSAPTAATSEMSSPARKALAHIEEYSQSGELSIELQEMVKNLQLLDKSLSLEEALDLLIESAVSKL